VSQAQKVFLFLISVVVVTAIGIPLFAPGLFKDTQWVAYTAAAFTLTGWLTREFFALRAMRKQHTVTVLLQSRMSTAFNDRYKALTKIYPVTPAVTPVSLGDWNDPAKVEAIEALKYFLNYYEFIAIGVRTGDLDEDYLHLSLSGIVPGLCNMGDAYIQFCRTTDQNTYKNLLWLKDRWLAARLKNETRAKRSIRLNPFG
jgi:hypothetical protein